MCPSLLLYYYTLSIILVTRLDYSHCILTTIVSSLYECNCNFVTEVVASNYGASQSTVALSYRFTLMRLTSLQMRFPRSRQHGYSGISVCFDSNYKICNGDPLMDRHCNETDRSSSERSKINQAHEARRKQSSLIKIHDTSKSRRFIGAIKHRFFSGR